MLQDDYIPNSEAWVRVDSYVHCDKVLKLSCLLVFHALKNYIGQTTMSFPVKFFMKKELLQIIVLQKRESLAEQ